MRTIHSTALHLNVSPATRRRIALASLLPLLLLIPAGEVGSAQDPIPTPRSVREQIDTARRDALLNQCLASADEAHAQCLAGELPPGACGVQRTFRRAGCSAAYNQPLDDSTSTAASNASTAAPAAGEAASSGRTATPALQTQAQRWEIRPNRELRGSTGQIVFAFPQMEGGGQNSVAVFEIGQPTQFTPTWYGSRSFPMLAGDYDVVINTVRVPRVPVQGGMDTRIHVGTIRFDTPAGTWVQVFDGDRPTALCSWNGPMTCGLPAGEYFVTVGGGGRRRVQLADGQVLDF